MNDRPDPSNPRKLQLACRLYRLGLIGHRFSRNLEPDEAERLKKIIESNGHGFCMFVDPETEKPMGAWLCTCAGEADEADERDCETQLVRL